MMANDIKLKKRDEFSIPILNIYCMINGDIEINIFQ